MPSVSNHENGIVIVSSIEGDDVAFRGPKDSQERGVSIIHQEPNLIPELSIAENIFLGREPMGRFGRIDWTAMRQEAQKLLDMLDVQFDPSTPVGKLSIGVQQMVEIAKALSFSSQVIVMDEPTDALTDKETESLFNGALLVKLAEGIHIDDAARFANAAAGISVTRSGAQTSIPGRDETEQFLAER